MRQAFSQRIEASLGTGRKWAIAAFSSAVMAAVFSAPGASYSAETVIGGITFEIPDITGYTVAEIGSDVHTQISNNAGSVNRLVKAYITEDDAARIASGEPPLLHSFVTILANIELESEDAPAEFFAELRDFLTNEQRGRRDWAVATNVRAETYKDLTPEERDALVGLDLPSQQRLAVPNSTDHLFTQTLLIRSGSIVRDNPKDARPYQVADVSFVRIQDRIFYVYVYNLFDEGSDIDATRAISDGFLANILKLNGVE